MEAPQDAHRVLQHSSLLLFLGRRSCCRGCILMRLVPILVRDTLFRPLSFLDCCRLCLSPFGPERLCLHNCRFEKRSVVVLIRVELHEKCLPELNELDSPVLVQLGHGSCEFRTNLFLRLHSPFQERFYTTLEVLYLLALEPFQLGSHEPSHILEK